MKYLFLKALVWYPLVMQKRGGLKGLSLLCYSLLLNPSYAVAETCTEIDYNKPTIAGGNSSTVGLKEDGTVVAVGYNGSGQLNVSDWTNIKSVATGTLGTLGLKEDGTVMAVGENWYGQLNVSGWTNIKAIAVGLFHTVGLKEDGTVVAVGDNSSNQLDVSDWTNIKAIAAGGELRSAYTVGLKEDGTVVMTGGGQLDWSNINPKTAFRLLEIV